MRRSGLLTCRSPVATLGRLARVVPQALGRSLLGLLLGAARRGAVPAGALFAALLLALALLLADTGGGGPNCLRGAVVGLDDNRAAARWIAAALAVAAAAGAQLVFMRLVADELYPAAPMLWTGRLKAVAIGVCWSGLLVAAVATFLVG